MKPRGRGARQHVPQQLLPEFVSSGEDEIRTGVRGLIVRGLKDFSFYSTSCRGWHLSVTGRAHPCCCLAPPSCTAV